MSTTSAKPARTISIAQDELPAAAGEAPWREARRQALLDAAARVFASKPFELASMDDIAHAAAVGKPTIYRYYPSKEALFEAVFIAALDGLDQRLAEVADEAASARERFQAMVSELIPTFRDHLVMLRDVAEDAAAARESRRKIFRTRREGIERRLSRILEDGIAAGEMRPLDTQVLASALIGMIWSAALAKPAARSGPRQARADEALAVILSDFIWSGVRAPCGAGDLR